MLPRDLAGAVEERIEIGGGKRGEPEKNAVRGAEPEVRAGDGALVALEGKPPGPERAALVSERLELASDDGLEPEGGGRNQRERHGGLDPRIT